MNKTALVLGCGATGSEFAREFVVSGGRAHGLRRRPAALPEGVVPMVGDLGDLRRATGFADLGPIDVLVHAASPGGRTVDRYAATYLTPLAGLREALGDRVGPSTRVVLVSSTSAFGACEGEVDESTPDGPRAPTADVLAEAEAAFRATFPGAVVVRLAGIYGPGRARLVDTVARGAAFEEPAEQIGNRIHVRDAGRLVHAVATAAAPEAVYVGVDEAPVPLGEVRAFVAERLGLPPEGFLPTSAPRGKRLHARAARRLGFGFEVPTYREGYPEVVAQYLATRAAG